MHTLAALVGLQRLDDRAHWASDVVVGAAYGIAVARAIIKLNENRHLRVEPAYNHYSGLIEIRLAAPF